MAIAKNEAHLSGPDEEIPAATGGPFPPPHVPARFRRLPGPLLGNPEDPFHYDWPHW
jgi:hypothetical protein